MERTTTLWLWFILMIFLGISINEGLSQGHQHLMKKTRTRSSAVVVGTVYCDTCFNSAFSKTPNHLIPGALVAVECIDEKSKPSFRQEVKTDERGEFKVKLPFSVSKHVKKIKRCSVKLLRSSQPYCSIASSATSSSLKRLKSSNHEENTSVFSAGFFTFKPENQPEICSQKPINLRESSKPLLPDPSFPKPIQDPVPNPSPLPILPPLPDLPQLPPLLPPGPQKSASLHNKKPDSLDDKKTQILKPDFFFPPNPLNPPSVIPPNPLIPSIPTPTLPPNPVIPSPPTLPLPLQPPPSSLIPPLPSIPTLPPVPGVTPPSQPPPSLPIPLPPVPGVPPVPLIPGVPPVPLIPGVPHVPLIPGVPPASSSFSSHHQP